MPAPRSALIHACRLLLPLAALWGCGPGSKPAGDSGGAGEARPPGGSDGGADSGDPNMPGPEGSGWSPRWGAIANEDGDGWMRPADCDPDDPSVYPNAPDTWYDGVDSDCRGDDDFDQDGDGDPLGLDCDDTDPSVFVGAPDRGGDGVDQDCDGVDAPPLTDDDGDGYDAALDCDDLDSSVHPGAPDRCGDGLDSACDGGGDCPLRGTTTLDRAYGLLTGEAAGDRLGQGEPGVLALGDADADGQAELLVTAVFGGPAREGRVYQLEAAAGERGVATAAAAVWTGEAADDQLGRGLAAPGDLNADGLEDLVASAPGADAAGADAGAVYLLPAGGGPLPAPFAVGPEAGAELGELCGAPGLGVYGGGALLAAAQFAGGGAGAVYLLVGATPLGGAAAQIQGAPGEELGSDLAVGDLDGDGLPELALGARGFGGDGRGAVHLFPGAIAGAYESADADARVHGLSPGDDVGWGISIALGADLDGDGYGDLVVGARGHDLSPTAPDGGLVTVWRGPLPPGSQGLNAAWASWVGAGESDWTGDSVALPGDVDGDGAQDLVIGSGYAEAAGSLRPFGAVYTVAGPLRGGTYDLGRDATGTGWAGSTRDRLRVHAAGDLNGDGRPDVAAGAQLHSTAGFEAGGVYLLAAD